MKLETFLLSIFLAMACVHAHAAEPAASRATDEAALRELKEILWPRAYFTGDARLLDRILADEFQSIDEDGVWSSKAEELAWVSKNRPSHDSFVFKIRRLDVFENGTAIVAGTGTIRGSKDGSPYIIEYQSSNIFIKRGGVWKAVASHVSGSKSMDSSSR